MRIILEESEALRAEAPDGLLTAEQLDWKAEHAAELEAEDAWLRAAESLGWEDDYQESLFESGLIVRPV